MTSSNKVRRYLQAHQVSSTDNLFVDSTTSMLKFQAKTFAIPQICVHHNNDEIELSTGRSLSLRPDEILLPPNQTRSLSFSQLTTNDQSMLKINNSSSKEMFARLFHSLTFRSEKNSSTRTNPCLACQDYPHLHLENENKKRPSIFGLLVAKLNQSNQHESITTRCSLCKRPLIKSISNVENLPASRSNKVLRHCQQKKSEPSFRTKRRRSLPSLLQTLFDASNVQRRPSFGPIIRSPSTSSFTDSEENSATTNLKTDELSSSTIDKVVIRDDIDHEVNSYQLDPNDISQDSNNVLLLQPPEGKSRSLLVNVFRTRRSSNVQESNMTSKQLSVSALNLATTISGSRRNSQLPLETRKHALSDENLPTMNHTSIYFANVNGEMLKENLDYSTITENTSLREVLMKLFEKHQLSIETCDICLRSAPTLPLSLDQPVKHLRLDDLIVTESSKCLRSRLLARTSAGKEKRYSTGSAVLSSSNCKSSNVTSKRFSTYSMMFDTEDTNRTNKIYRPDVNESTENNLTFLRRKCDEWLLHGLPKLAQLHISIDECDLMIKKTEQTRSSISESVQLQQEAIYEMLSTEVSYIRQILTMTDVFMTSVSILKSSERDGIFDDIDMEKLFSNIPNVIEGNLLFWKEILLPIKIKFEQTGSLMNPSDLKNGFLQFEFYFKSYLQYVLDQKSTAEYFKQKFARDELFQYLITWIEANFTNRLSFADLTIKPLQRLTRYKLLLEAIQRKTFDHQQRLDLQEMIEKVATFVNQVNSKLDCQEQEERIRQINDRIGPFENISAPPELTSILQEYQRDSMTNRFDLLADMPLFVQGYRRQIIQQGPMKMKDIKSNQDVYCYLFSDLFLITKGNKRTDPSTSRNTKILKVPIRIDRLDVKEYESNSSSFVALLFSEYNLIECAFLFQTNLSKQWMENIRRTKINFQLLLEESKVKLANLHRTEFRSSSETRRNSRQDRKQFGRYFTADGTTTSERMSWNNENPMEKIDSSLITHSFRSVHSSSGVSSTGSFLFSTDEDSTTSSSIQQPINDNTVERDSRSTIISHVSPIDDRTEKTTLRRTPFPTVKRRHHHRRLDPTRDLSNDNRLSAPASGNESDYDNNLPHSQSDNSAIISRPWIDIRSHLLLNTTLDATEV